MEQHYQVEYKETIETLTSVCELYELDNSDLMLKFVAAVLGPIVFVFMFIYGSPGDGTPEGAAVFLFKFLAVWAAAFAAAMVINRTIWGKAVRAAAAGNAEGLYEKRRTAYKKEAVSRMDFYGEHFDSVTPSKKKSFSYEYVVKFIETKQAFGLVVRSEEYRFGGPKELFGFPKEALPGGEFEEFKKFLLGRCPKARVKKF